MTSRMSGTADLSSGSGSGSASSKVAAKDMDHVVGEMALLQARCRVHKTFSSPPTKRANKLKRLSTAREY